MSPSKQKLKIGLIVSRKTIPAWAFNLTEWIQQSDFAELKLVILYNHPKEKTCRNILHKIRFFLFAMHQTFEKIVFKPKPDALREHLISDITGSNPIELNPHPEASSALQKKRESIVSERIDVLIAVHPFLPDERLIGMSKFGIWTVETSTPHQKDFSTTAVWEVFQQKPVTDLCLTIHHKKTIRFKVSFATIKNSIRWNRNFHYWKAMCCIQAKLEQLYKLGWAKLIISGEASPAATNKKVPGNLAVLGGTIRMFSSYIGGKIGNLLYREQWTILFSLQNNKKNSLQEFHRIIPPKDRLWADPFVIKKENKTCIFAEEMRYREQKGKIIATEIDQSGVPGKPITVLELNHHLSYPYLFNEGGHLFMIPETTQKRTIELYKCLKFPDRWTYSKTILKGLEAADASLLKHNDTYWLFANVRMHEGVSINDDLFLFFSNDLFGDEWTPHPMNPIVTDVRFARPAGQITIRNNRLIRPAQDCSKRYGYAIQLMEIIELNETDYRERHLQTFLPGWETGVLGVHTYNLAEGIAVSDALIRRKKF